MCREYAIIFRTRVSRVVRNGSTIIVTATSPPSCRSSRNCFCQWSCQGWSAILHRLQDSSFSHDPIPHNDLPLIAMPVIRRIPDNKRRSRTGCIPCRRRRRKCNQSPCPFPQLSVRVFILSNEFRWRAKTPVRKLSGEKCNMRVQRVDLCPRCPIFPAQGWTCEGGYSIWWRWLSDGEWSP